MNKMPAWDLSDFYKSIEDEQIQKDLDFYQKSAQNFADKYKGKLAELSAEEFLEAIKDIEQRSKTA